MDLSVTVKQFIHQLSISGVMTPDEISSASADIAADSGEELARALVKQKKLTKYQAQQIFRGKARQLLLGDYVVLDKIGAGGMGQVSLAEHRRMGRQVAIKTLPPAMSDDEHTILRFQREVRAAARLSHPNIVTAFDAGEDKGVHYFVMEYVEGIDLSKLVKHDGPLTVERAVDYVRQAARGLQYAHDEGIVHRDIKPANLLLDRKGRIKILDMGLARIERRADEKSESGLTPTGMVMGTVDYMAPEQALDTRQADARSDIYSLGCVLHFLVTAKSIYTGDTMVKKILAHREQPVPSLSVGHAGTPDALDLVFQKMVAKDADNRQQTMLALIGELDACIPSPTTNGADDGRDSATLNDPAFSKFLKDQAAVSTPTIVHQTTDVEAPPGEQEVIAVRHQGTNLPQESLLPHRKKRAASKLSGKTGLIAAVCLLGAAGAIWGLSGIFTDGPTKGVLQLQFEQSELSGAMVLLDDQEHSTVQSAEGGHSVDVDVDDTPHTLKVTHPGFEPFVKQYTMTNAESLSIPVRMVPESDLGSASTSDGSITGKGSGQLDESEMSAADLLATGAWEWKLQEPIGPPLNTHAWENSATMSADQCNAVFGSTRLDGTSKPEEFFLWTTSRADDFDQWSDPVNLSATFGVADRCSHPNLSSDGLILTFLNIDAGSLQYVQRTSLDSEWSSPKELPVKSSPFHLHSLSRSPDGLSMIISMSATSVAASDLWLLRRASPGDEWSPPQELPFPIRTAEPEIAGAISNDGRTLIMTRGLPAGDLFMSTRADWESSWSNPVPIDSLNTEDGEFMPRFVNDDRTLLFSSNRPGGQGSCDIYVAQLVRK